MNCRVYGLSPCSLAGYNSTSDARFPDWLIKAQDCPTCGRKLLIRVEYLGKTLVCQHCRGGLFACDLANAPIDEVDHSSKIMQRADELIASVDHHRTSNTG
jgi:hypothetical protein